VKKSDHSAASPDLVARAAGALEQPAWVAGGWVRDRLLGRTSADADLVIEGDPEAAARAAADSLRGSFVVLDAARRIYRVALPHAHVDFTAMRGASIEQDLKKRDFTINAVGLPASRAPRRLWRRDLVDPTGGLSDIAEKVVRPTGPSVFEEDPLRTMRAIRLAAALGFSLPPSTRRAIGRHAHLLSGVAAERVRDELFPVLRSRQAHLHLDTAQRLGLMRIAMPEIEPLRGLRQGRHHRLDAWGHTLEALRHLNRLLRQAGSWAGRFEKKVRTILEEPTSGDRTRADMLRFACLLHDIGKPATLSFDERGMHFYGHPGLGGKAAAAAARRLRMSRLEASAVRALVENHMRPLLLTRGEATARALRRLVADVGDRCAELACLALADLMAGRPSRAAVRVQRDLTARLLAHLFTRPAVRRPLLNGREVMARYGLQQGPIVGWLLETVRRAQLERGIKTREEAWAVLDVALATRDARPR
jgi:poly(A) polymerase